MPRGRRLTSEEKDKIRSMIERNCDRQTIADELGVSVVTVTRYRKECGVDFACHRTSHNGKIVHDVPPVFPEEENKAIIKASKPLRLDSLIVAEKTLIIKGVGTGFNYKISTVSEDVIIETGYNEPFKIDMRDLLGFAKELVQVAEKLDNMKKHVWDD